MFCLRTWIPLLFFLSNVSPLYFILFVGATYYLSRPCIYCSLLLTILVFCYYDFHTNWFDSQPGSTPLHESYTSASQNGSMLQNAAMGGASIAANVLNSTAASIVQGAYETAKRKLGTHVELPPQMSAAEWMKELLGKKEWRIACLDIAIRF